MNDIYRVVGRNLKFLDFFQIFGAITVKNDEFFSLNGRIHIQILIQIDQSAATVSLPPINLNNR
jgi:hypothetical protein